MNKLIISLILLLLSINSYGLTLSSTVDRTTIGVDETLMLTVTLDKQGSETIDFSQLETQFDIINRQQSSQTSIVNGTLTAKTQWNLILAPKESGTLIIPSFSVGGAFSDAITIHVTKISPNHQTGQKNDSDVFLQASVNKPAVYVQEQLLLTLRLYYKISLSGYTPEDLEIPRSTMELAAENNFQTTYQGTRYNVLEKVYAIHPQASGTINIPVQSWQVEKSSRGFGFGQITSPYLRVRSQPIQIDVKPIPQASTAKQWLPASQLSLTQQWQQSTITAKVGEPLTYSLLLKAHGLSHSQLPSLSISSNEDFTIYGDLPQVENSKSQQGVVGSRTENYAVIPKKAGTFTLPPITLRWWNVTTNQEETITLAEQQIIVANSEIAKDSLPDTPSISSQPQAVDSENNNRLMYWQISSILFACLSLVFFILWQRKSKSHLVQNVEVEKQTSKSQKALVLQSLSHIEQAIDQQQWQKLRIYLLQWAGAVVQQPITSSQEFTHHFPDLAEAISTLDKQLYDNNSVVVWDFKELLPLLKKQRYSKPSIDEKKPVLKPLYTN